MPQPVKITNNIVSGSISRGVISYAIEGQDRDYITLDGGDWYSGVLPDDGRWVIISESNAGGTPSFWITADSTDSALLTTVNGLPARYNQTAFTDTGSALAYLASSDRYIVLRSTPDNTDADGVVLNVEPGIIASYPQTSSVLYDLSGNGLNGTLTNGPTWSPGGYFIPDATDDYITFGNPTKLNFTSSMSHEVWFWRDSNATTNLRLSSKGAGGGSVGQQGFSFFGSNTSIIWSVNVDGVRTNLNAPITIGKWYQVVGTADLDTGDQKIYLNGEEINSGTLGGSITMASGISFILGSYFDPGNLLVWDGKIGPARIYNKSLSLGEVKQNYFGGPIVTDGLVFAVDPSNLVSYESGSTTTYSLTGSYTGSLQNGVGYKPDNGGVFNFDGIDDIIRSQNITPSEISIEVWKKWTVVSDDWLITNQISTVTDTSKGYMLRIDSPSYNFIVYFGTGPSAKFIVYNPIVLGEWTHVLATYDPVTEGAKLYWNGKLVGTDPTTGAIDYTGVQGLTIGAANDLSRATPGPVGAVRIYDRALTADEVAQNYNASKQKYQF